MTFKQNAGLLAKTITLLCAAYLPQAHANVTTDFGTINAPVTEKLVDNKIDAGPFADTYFFNITTDAHIDSIAVSYSWTSTTSYPDLIGADLFSLNLDNAAGNVVGSVLTTGTTTTSSPSYDASTGQYGYTYTASIATTSLTAGSEYAIVITGNGGPFNYTAADSSYAPGFYTGSLTLNTLPAPPVPEPEQWAMLLLGLPLVSWIARKKQSPLRLAALA